jgi:hypothetical protein
MTDDDNTPGGFAVQLGALVYETVIAVSSVAVGVEQIRKRPDAAHLNAPLKILEELAREATEAAITLQDEMWRAFGLHGVSREPANDPEG